MTHSISTTRYPWSCKRPNTPLYYFVMPENQQAKDFFWQAGCLKSRSLMSAKCANIKKNTIWRHFTSFLVLSHCAKIWKSTILAKPLYYKKLLLVHTTNTLFHKLRYFSVFIPLKSYFRVISFLHGLRQDRNLFYVFEM